MIDPAISALQAAAQVRIGAAEPTDTEVARRVGAAAITGTVTGVATFAQEGFDGQRAMIEVRAANRKPFSVPVHPDVAAGISPGDVVSITVEKVAAVA